ncbi:hypothetical protein F5146DRAFT_1201100 [Armillaria mellea]|nr:hypothetical protein F5146DRAFT_1201100 [Armillaria mellea]
MAMKIASRRISQSVISKDAIFSVSRLVEIYRPLPLSRRDPRIEEWRFPEETGTTRMLSLLDGLIGETEKIDRVVLTAEDTHCDSYGYPHMLRNQAERYSLGAISTKHFLQPSMELFNRVIEQDLLKVYHHHLNILHGGPDSARWSKKILYEGGRGPDYGVSDVHDPVFLFSKRGRGIEEYKFLGEIAVSRTLPLHWRWIMQRGHRGRMNTGDRKIWRRQ